MLMPVGSGWAQPAKPMQLSRWGGKRSVKWAAPAANWWATGPASSAMTPTAFSPRNLFTACTARCAGGMRRDKRPGALQATRHGLAGGAGRVAQCSGSANRSTTGWSPEAGDQRRPARDDGGSVAKGEWASGSHGGSCALAQRGDGAGSGVGQQECSGSCAVRRRRRWEGSIL